MVGADQIRKIANASDLAALIVDIRTGRRRMSSRGFHFDLPGLERDRQDLASEAFNAAYFDCVCQPAMTGGLVALALSGLYVLTAGGPALSWSTPAILLGSFAVGVAAGKLLGRARQNRRLAAMVDELVVASGMAKEISRLGNIGNGALCAH